MEVQTLNERKEMGLFVVSVPFACVSRGDKKNN